MARHKKMAIGAINITVHPHSPQTYVDLFYDTFNSKKTQRIHGDQFGLIGSIKKSETLNNEEQFLHGTIYRFTNIDPDAPWFNFETNDFANENEIDKIKIPENLKPNSRMFYFCFFPNQHLFTYTSYSSNSSITPKSMESFLNRLLNSPELEGKYGPVTVTNLPEKNDLTEALALPTKEMIYFAINRPNPDENNEDEDMYLQRLENQNVGLEETKLKAQKNKSLLVTEDTKLKAAIAAKNGVFKLKGRDSDSNIKEFSTKEHPVIFSEYYDPDKNHELGFFKQISFDLKKSLENWSFR